MYKYLLVPVTGADSRADVPDIGAQNIIAVPSDAP